MITTNLLPHERRRGVGTPLLMRLLIITLGSIILIGVLGFALYENKVSIDTANQIAALEEKENDLNVQLEPVLDLERRQKILNEKKRVIDRLILQRLEWAPKLNLLAKLVPERIWLEGLEIISEKVKMQRKEPVPGSTTPSGKPKMRVKKYTVIKKRLVVKGVTDDLNNKNGLVGEFIRNIESDKDFGESFSNIGRVEAVQEHWRRRDTTSPMVWRFEFSMEIKDRGQNDDESEASGKA